MNDEILSIGDKRAQVKKFIEIFDESGTGTISKAELMNYFAKRFDEKIV